MGSIFATRRNGTKVLRPRFMLAAASDLTAQDRRNIDALVDMHDYPAGWHPEPKQPPSWARKLQRAAMEDVLRTLSAGRAGSERQVRAFDEDLRWVQTDTGVPGMRLRDICLEFAWDYGEVRTRLLLVAKRAAAGQSRRVPTLARPRREKRALSVA